MSGFDVGQTLGDIVDGLVKVSESVKVIGEPIEAAEKVIIPAVMVRLGFGAGGGSGSRASEEREGSEEGVGGGGGGGMMLSPIFLVVDSEGERLITVPGVADIASAALGKVRQALDHVMPRRGEDTDDEPEQQS